MGIKVEIVRVDGRYVVQEVDRMVSEQLNVESQLSDCFVSQCVVPKTPLGSGLWQSNWNPSDKHLTWNMST